jgi:hypothetical protein
MFYVRIRSASRFLFAFISPLRYSHLVPLPAVLHYTVNSCKSNHVLIMEGLLHVQLNLNPECVLYKESSYHK